MGCLILNSFSRIQMIRVFTSRNCIVRKYLHAWHIERCAAGELKGEMKVTITTEVLVPFHFDEAMMEPERVRCSDWPYCSALSIHDISAVSPDGYPFVVLVTWNDDRKTVWPYSKEGGPLGGGAFLALKKEVVTMKTSGYDRRWVNVYRNDSGFVFLGSAYLSEEQAIEGKSCIGGYVKTISFEV